MPTVQITDEKKYTSAIGLLHEMGGIFRTKPVRQLVIGPNQLQALQAAGLVPNPKGTRKRGKEKPSLLGLATELPALNQQVPEDLFPRLSPWNARTMLRKLLSSVTNR